MLLDARRHEDADLATDFCVVGAGPAGLAVTLQLARAGRQVLLVDSGGWKSEKETDTLSSGEVVAGSAHPPLHLYRPRRIGGGTTVWGGRCVLYDPIDFQPRSWMPLSGWPLSFDELRPFYAQATRFCDAGEFAYSAAAALGARAADFLPALQGTDLETDLLDRFSRPSNLGRLYRRELATLPSVRLLHHATLTGIEVAGTGGNVVALSLRTTTGKSFQVRPRRVVLAMGTLETVRMLLASHGAAGPGLGNQHGMLGRCYLSHLEAVVGALQLSPATPARLGFERSADGVYVQRRLRISDTVQRRLQIGNGIIRLHRPQLADSRHGHAVLSAAWLVKNTLRHRRRTSWNEVEATRVLRTARPQGFVTAHWRNVASGLPGLLAFTPWWIWHRWMAGRRLPSLIPQSRKAAYPLCFILEQAPNLDSRIRLGAVRDRFGVPQLAVDWRTCEMDRRTIRKTMALVATVLAGSGVGLFRYDEAAAVASFVPTGGHQLGGARMSHTARQGVVDENCRVHGVRNLYLAGNAVLPTAGHANPTLTLVALALRLAAHLGGLG